MKKPKNRPPRPAPEIKPGRPWWLYFSLLAAFVAAFLAYGPALRGPFLFDDLRLPFTRAAELATPWTFYLRSVRPLLNVLFWWEGNTWGMNPAPYHLLNFVVHCANTALVWFILRRLAGSVDPLAKPLPDGRGSAKDVAGEVSVAAWFGAGLFLLHPLQTEAVSYIASRSETLSVFFAYGAFAAFVAWFRDRIGWARAIAVVFLFVLGVATKEHVAVLPAALLLTDYWWNPGFTFAGMRRNGRLYGLFLAGAAAAAAIIVPVLRDASTAGFGLRDFTWYQYFFTQCRALWVYFRLFVLPFGQNLDYQFPISRSLADPFAAAGLLALVALVAAAWIYRRRFPYAAYGLFVFLILIAPTSSFVPIQDALAERRLYLPSIGLLFIIVEVLLRWKPDRARQAALAAVLVVLAIITWNRNQVYSSAVAMWDSSVKANPTNARAEFQLAYAYYTEGNCAGASQHYAKAAALKTPAYDLLTDWALALDCAGKPSEAVQRLNEALKLERNAHGYSILGMVYGKQGRNDDALAALEEAIRIDPGYDMAWVYKGNVLVQKGDKSAAAEAFRRAIALNPSNPAAQQGLAATR